MGLQECIFLGNLDARLEWGHAKNFVELQLLMLQELEPDVYVIAIGQQHSVREFVEIAWREIGIEIHRQGNGIEEIGMDSRTSKTVVRIDTRYFRPKEVDSLLGYAGKALEKLGWTPRISFEEMVREMVAHNLREVERDALG